MAKPVTGQYECEHRSSLGIGLGYYTARLDRLTLYQNGRFLLIVQEKSRAAHAAKTLLQGQQLSMAAPEVKREGSYTLQGSALTLNFDDGGLEQGQVSWNDNGIQLGPNHFNKVSDTTLLPPTNRVKKDMEDIAKGLKIAGTIGGIAMKAAKEIQGAMHTTPTATPTSQTQPAAQQPPTRSTPPQPQPVSQPPTRSTPPVASQPQPIYQPPAEALFCDQCGARARPGKRFCSQCGADLPQPG